MKKMVTRTVEFLRKNSFSVVGAIALFVGTAAAFPTTWTYTHQPECPTELLK